MELITAIYKQSYSETIGDAPTVRLLAEFELNGKLRTTRQRCNAVSKWVPSSSIENLVAMQDRTEGGYSTPVVQGGSTYTDLIKVATGGDLETVRTISTIGLLFVAMYSDNVLCGAVSLSRDALLKCEVALLTVSCDSNNAEKRMRLCDDDAQAERQSSTLYATSIMTTATIRNK